MNGEMKKYAQKYVYMRGSESKFAIKKIMKIVLYQIEYFERFSTQDFVLF